MSENNLPKMPEFKINQARNGYELRTDILAMAKDLLSQDFHYKWALWEMSVKKDDETGEMVTSVSIPEFPGLDKIMETAQRMYEFVNIDTSKRR